MTTFALGNGNARMWRSERLGLCVLSVSGTVAGFTDSWSRVEILTLPVGAAPPAIVRAPMTVQTVAGAYIVEVGTDGGVDVVSNGSASPPSGSWLHSLLAWVPASSVS